MLHNHDAEREKLMSDSIVSAISKKYCNIGPFSQKRKKGKRELWSDN